MPANLPPTYFKTEEKLKTATTPEEKIAILEELLAIIPKHKGTEKLQAGLKTKIAKFKNMAHKKSGTAKRGYTHGVKRSGAGQVVLAGAPNTGKSHLIQSLTNASPMVSSNPYSTHAAMPAMMPYENIQIQLVDTPPITQDYIEAWLADLLKTTDVVMLVADLADPVAEDSLQSVVDKLVEKRIELLGEGREPALENVVVSKKALIVANKTDAPQAAEKIADIQTFFGEDFDIFPVSAVAEQGLDQLRLKLFNMLEVIRVYSKIPGKKAEFTDPFTLKKGSTVMDLTWEVHKDFADKLKFARIWNKSQYQGQRVHRNHPLEDEDIIELHI